MIKRDQSFSGSPLLYLIATPIGNLKEFSERALETIDEMDFIACEDTRNTSKLLSLFGRKKALIACHKFNEKEAAERLVALIKEGKKIAYMSDAGYPVVSDPGALLVAECLKNDIMVSAVNGPSAAVMSLALSGFPSDHFYFHGFLDPKEKAALKSMEPLKDLPCPTIFYVPPHRVKSDLEHLYMAYGGDRRIAICRELTKLHEEVIRCDLKEAITIDEKTLIGEIVVVVEGKGKEKTGVNEEEIVKALKEALKTQSPKDAVKAVSNALGIPKNNVYEFYLTHFKNDN